MWRSLALLVGCVAARGAAQGCVEVDAADDLSWCGEAELPAGCCSGWQAAANAHAAGMSSAIVISFMPFLKCPACCAAGAGDGTDGICAVTGGGGGSWMPSAAPTATPTTSEPTTSEPTVHPTQLPTTSDPTTSPTTTPTTSEPTMSPTASPTTSGPTASPTASPTGAPTVFPTTSKPTGAPTLPPTGSPTTQPTYCGLDLAGDGFCAALTDRQCCDRGSSWQICRATCCDRPCAAPLPQYDAVSIVLPEYLPASETGRAIVDPEMTFVIEAVRAYLVLHTELETEDFIRVDLRQVGRNVEAIAAVSVNIVMEDVEAAVRAAAAAGSMVRIFNHLAVQPAEFWREILPQDPRATKLSATHSPTVAPSACADEDFSPVCAQLDLPRQCCSDSTLISGCVQCCGHECQGGSYAPTANPTSSEPSAHPTSMPSTSAPTTVPTANPTTHPTSDPTAVPTAKPTANPTGIPTAIPTANPTANPTAPPTSAPSTTPTTSPTACGVPNVEDQPFWACNFITASACHSRPRTEWARNCALSCCEYSAAPTTATPTTAAPSTAAPVTSAPSTSVPVTSVPTLPPTPPPTPPPTTRSPTPQPTLSPTSLPTPAPTTRSPTTSEPTTAPTTLTPTTSEPTRGPTPAPTTGEPTPGPTATPTTPEPTPAPTPAPATGEPTPTPTTATPTTATPTPAPTTGSPTTGFEQRELVIEVSWQAPASRRRETHCGSAADAATAARVAAPDIRARVTALPTITAGMFIYSMGYSFVSSPTSGYAAGIHYEIRSTVDPCVHTIVYTVPLRQLTSGGPTSTAVYDASTAINGSSIPALSAAGFGTMRATTAVGCDVGSLNPLTKICQCDQYHDLESAFTTPGHTCANEVAENGVRESILLGGGINHEVCDICARSCCIVLWPFDAPTVSPSISPSTSPTSSPSISPSTAPSISPSNSPSTSPTVSPTTSEPSVAPSRSPSRSPTITTCPRDLDIVFVLDDSRSVTLGEFENMKSFFSDFLYYYAWDAVPSMSPPKHGTRIGMVTFSGEGEYVGSAKTHFQLGQTNSLGVPWTRDYTRGYLGNVLQVGGNDRSGTTHTDRGVEQAICLLDHTFVSRTGNFSCQVQDECGYRSAYDRGVCSSDRLLVRVNSTSGAGFQAYPRDLPFETEDVLTRDHGPRQLNKQIHKVVVVLTDGLPESAGSVDHITPTIRAVNMLRDEVNADVHLVTVGSSDASRNAIIQEELMRIFGIGDGRRAHSNRAHFFESYQQLSDVAARELAEAVCPYCAADMHSDCANRVRFARLGCNDPEAYGCNSTCCQTQSPTVSPTSSPTSSTPTDAPSTAPTTSGPTDVPTSMPTSAEPTDSPSTSPTRMPTVMHCPNQLDVSFLIDSSSSNNQIEYIKGFVKQTMTGSNYFYNSQPDVNPNVGIASFAFPGLNEDQYYPRVEFAQDSVGTQGTPEQQKQRFDQDVDRIYTTGGLTFIWPALDMIRPNAPGNPMGWRPVEEGRRRVVVVVSDGRFTDFGHPFAEPEFYGPYTGYPGYMKKRDDQWADEMRWPPCDGCIRNGTSGACSGATDSCTPLCDYKKSLAAEGIEVIGIPTDVISLDSLPGDVSATWQMLADRIPVDGEPITTPGGIWRLQQAICYPRPQDEPSLSTCETRMPTASPSPSPTTVSPTTRAPSPSPTTDTPTTAEPTAAPTSAPTTTDPTTAAPVTAAPVTSAPTTPDPTTAAPVTAAPVTMAPATSAPTTSVPSLAPTLVPATSEPSTSPTTSEPTACSAFQDTVMSRNTCLMMRAAGECGEQMIANLCGFTCAGCDFASPTPSPTIAPPTTSDPTTSEPTTSEPTTSEPTTLEPTLAPTANPTPAPTRTPTSSEPTPGPTPGPSPNPTPAPTSICVSGSLEDRLITATECQSLAQVGACIAGVINRYCAYSCAGCSYAVPTPTADATQRPVVTLFYSTEPPAVTQPPVVTEPGPSTELPVVTESPVTTLPNVTEPGPVVLEGNSGKNCSALQAETAGQTAAEGGWVFRDPDQLVCAASNISGLCWGRDRQHRVSFEDATEICRTAGARLCSTDELASNYARGTGCSLDLKPVWAIDGTRRFGASTTRTIPASVTRSKFAVRCCADAVGRNPAPAVDSAERSSDPCVHLVRTHGFIIRNSASGVCATSFEGTWDGATGGCPPTQTFATSQGMCQSVGARLCTTTELTGDLAMGTGCGIDASKKVWTSDSCNSTSGPSFRTSGGSSFSTAGSECARDTEVTRSVRCCGDAVSAAAAARSDAVAGGDGSGSSSLGQSVTADGPTATTVALAAVMVVAVLGAIAAGRRHRNRETTADGKVDGESTFTLPAAVQVEPVDGPPPSKGIAWE